MKKPTPGTSRRTPHGWTRPYESLTIAVKRVSLVEKKRRAVVKYGATVRYQDGFVDVFTGEAPLLDVATKRAAVEAFVKDRQVVADDRGYRLVIEPWEHLVELR